MISIAHYSTQENYVLMGIEYTLPKWKDRKEMSCTIHDSEDNAIHYWYSMVHSSLLIIADEYIKYHKEIQVFYFDKATLYQNNCPQYDHYRTHYWELLERYDLIGYDPSHPAKFLEQYSNFLDEMRHTVPSYEFHDADWCIKQVNEVAVLLEQIKNTLPKLQKRYD